MKVLGVIPARLHSIRLPRKVLLPIHGKPMVQHVYERARQCNRLASLVVATDALEVLEVCEENDIPCVLTWEGHESGTDRVYEAFGGHSSFDVCVNIQADEPLLNPAHLDALLAPFDAANVMVSTLRAPIFPEDARDSNCVKVVCDRFDDALYFSRWPIPFDRAGKGGGGHFHHIGLYAYTREALRLFHYYQPGRLERIEHLEQLRFLENGIKIRVVKVEKAAGGVNTPEDLRRVIEVLS